MGSESTSKTKRPTFHYVIGTTLLLSSVTVVFIFADPPGAKSIATNSHGAEPVIGIEEGMAKLQSNHAVISTHKKESRDDDFVAMLQKAATDEKIVILTEVNEAYAAPNSMLDLFLESFHNGDNIAHLLNHMIIVAMDTKAFEKCKSVHRHCYLHEQLGDAMNSEKAYLSRDFLDLVWSKVELWQFILEQGYSFLFTDVDVMWFRDPFRQISIYADLTLAADVFYGNPEDHNNMPNTGLVFAKPTKKNIEALRYWQGARKRFPGTNEQTVYDKIKLELASEFDLKVQYVSTAYWGNFCQPQMKDLSRLSTFHACCRAGLAVKLAHIKSVIEEWKMYKSNFLKN